MDNVLVTGANGQLGNELRRRASGGGNCRYVFTDVAELDITDLEAVRRCMDAECISVVVNCAAYTNVDKAEDDVVVADAINHLAAGNLALACRERDAVLLHVSTDYVFGGRGTCLTGRRMRHARSGFTGGRSWRASRRLWIAAAATWCSARRGFIPPTGTIS